MLEQRQRIRAAIEFPDAGRRRRRFVFVELRIQMALAGARAVARKNDVAVARVQRLDVVDVRFLAGNERDRHLLALAETGDLVDLPVVVVVIVLVGGCADEHAEERFRAAPVDDRIAHRDRSRALHAVVAEAGFRGEIAQRAVGIADPQIAAARDFLHRRAVIGKNRSDRAEAFDRNLRDEQDGVREINGRCRRRCSGAGRTSEHECGQQRELGMDASVSSLETTPRIHPGRAIRLHNKSNLLFVEPGVGAMKPE